MQTQNQHLLQQVTARDDYNIKVVFRYQLSFPCSVARFLPYDIGRFILIPSFYLFFNAQLVSESVKTKQAQSSLRAEKQALTKQLQQINTLLDSLKARIIRGEEQV